MPPHTCIDLKKEKKKAPRMDEPICVTITAEDQEKFKRLDQLLNHKIAALSRTFIKKLFLKDQINIVQDLETDHKIKLELKKMPPVGTVIEINIPPPIDAKAKAENIPLEILFEDEHLLFVNKPAGMVTHPAPGHYTGTLVNAVLYHCPDLTGIGDEKRPGIVHRLDMGTSGIMVVAKTQACHEGLVLLFSSHEIERIYEALVMGNSQPAGGTLSSTIGRNPRNRLKMAANVRGKHATSHYKALEYFEKFSHMQLKLETGRTHQIRVHLNDLLKSPILMDPLYGNPQENIQRLGANFTEALKDYPYPFLHAKTLGLIHPITKEKLFFEVSPPPEFQKILEIAKSL